MTAEDLASETFLSAAGTLARHPESQPSVAWLIGIARHKLVDHWRRRGRDERLAEASAPDSDLGDQWEVRLDAIHARGVLDALADHHRLALTLRYVDDLPVPDVAALLHRTVYATEALLARARSAYRNHYEQAEGHAH
jgi:RNA polymerase sigma-70 factor (ECF subfamily)